MKKIFVQSRGLKQAAHGIYLSKDAWVDAMYLLHLRCPQAVFSHETALFLKAYARRKDKDLRTLVRFAKLFRVEKIFRQYLEVLL